MTFAPSASSAALASSREHLLERARDHVGRCPVSGPSTGRVLLAGLEPQARARAAPARARGSARRANHSTTSSARSGPKPSTSCDLLLRRRRSAGRRCRSAARGSGPSPSRRRGCSARRGRARTGSAFEAWIASIALRAPRSRRSRRARAAAPSSAGRGRAASARARGPRAGGSICSPTPSMSAAAMTQLISVSRPRDGQARFGQRCIDLALGLDDVGAAERALLRHPERLRPGLVRARPARRSAGSRRRRAGR